MEEEEVQIVRAYLRYGPKKILLIWISYLRFAHVCTGTKKEYFIIFPEDRSRKFFLNLSSLTKNRVLNSTISAAVKICLRQN